VKHTIRLLLITSGIFIFTNSLFSQNPKKQVKAVRIEQAPVIDGLLNEGVWQAAQPATDFIQYDPYNGPDATERTEVKILYDNVALYIGAMMYDISPDSILTELGFRDSDNLNADFFSVDISTFNDGLNSVAFMVTASGVQLDAKVYNDDDDDDWNAVWQSEVKIVDSGWSAELKIPYSALRFPEIKDQTWGLNLWRSIRRKRETDSWNFVDKEIDGKDKQAGELTHLIDIKPPLRLSLTPYVSGYVENLADDANWGYSFNYGMGLKYGINESFTLDATLIPDFGQVQSDDQIYNLSPFEVYYEEKRPFFTEGTELFDKGDIFYSRRVGDEPDLYWAVNDSLGEGEYISDNPGKAKLINATKISGRTNGGLGIGVFNAMSANTFATIKDSLNNSRTIETQPFSNYNMVVLDQNLRNNSYISFYNTNVYKGKNHYTANVSGTEFQLFNKSASYSFFGMFNTSQKYNPHEKTDLGFLYSWRLIKTSGQLRFHVGQHVETDTYNPNDLGYLQSNNEISYNASLDYNFYDPFWKLLNLYNSITVWYESLYAPRNFTEFGIFARTRGTFRNYLTTGLNIDINPVESHDYYESRTDGRVYLEPPKWELGTWFSPDYRKPFIIDLRVNFERSSRYDQTSYSIVFSPRWRVNDRLTFRLNSEYERDLNDIGYVDDRTIEEAKQIIFGRRNLQTVENVIQTTYIFNNKLALDFRLRHYWLKALYNKFYRLDQDGYPDPTDYNTNNDFNFNAFNIDMIVRWEFAPGSELAVAWKNAILTFNDGEVVNKFFNNLKNTLESPADNSFSVKLLYYLDYLYLKKKK